MPWLLTYIWKKKWHSWTFKEIPFDQLFEANELLKTVKIENVSLIEKVKELETDLGVVREQLSRPSSSKLDEMLGVQKSYYDKSGLGFAESSSSSKITLTKFVPSVSMPKLKVKVHKEEILATRRIRIDLSDTKPKQSVHPVAKK